MKEWIVGRNPIYEAIKARRRHFFQLWVAKGIEETPRVSEIIQNIRALRLPVLSVARQQLDSISDHHQGIALETNGYTYSDIPSMFKLAEQREEPLFLLILDVIQDPQNLGTLIRSAEAVGVQGVILPLRQAAGVTPSVVHASAGATEHMLVAQANLAQAIQMVKDVGGWVFGLEGSSEAQPLESVTLDGPLALVVGSEGEGLRNLTRKNCDSLIQLPMRGQVESLNASVAGSVVLYAALEARIKKTLKVNNSDH